MKTLFPLTLLLALVACYNPVLTKKSPEEQVYFDKVMATPKEVSIHKAQSEEAWGRAQVFLSKYGSMKMQTITDHVIQTYNPTSGRFAYEVTKLSIGDSVRISVNCFSNIFGSTITQQADFNARALAYFMLTGEVVSRLVPQVDLGH